MKSFIVAALEWGCGRLDRVRWLPWPLTLLRCPSGMAAWSARLDERWDAGVWEKP